MEEVQECIAMLDEQPGYGDRCAWMHGAEQDKHELHRLYYVAFRGLDQRK